MRMAGEGGPEMEERTRGGSAVSRRGTELPLKTLRFTSCSFWSWDSMISSMSGRGGRGEGEGGERREGKGRGEGEGGGGRESRERKQRENGEREEGRQ